MRNRYAHGYWQDIENVLSKIREIKKELGYFPTKKYFIQNNLLGLLDSIYRTHTWSKN